MLWGEVGGGWGGGVSGSHNVQQNKKEVRVHGGLTIYDAGGGQSDCDPQAPTTNHSGDLWGQLSDCDSSTDPACLSRMHRISGGH